MGCGATRTWWWTSPHLASPLPMCVESTLGGAPLDPVGTAVPLLQHVDDSLRGAAVAVRERRPGHARIGLAVLEESGDGVDDGVTVGADEGCVACLDGLAALGGLAQDEHGPSERGASSWTPPSRTG